MLSLVLPAEELGTIRHYLIFGLVVLHRPPSRGVEGHGLQGSGQARPPQGYVEFRRPVVTSGSSDPLVTSPDELRFEFLIW